MTNTSEKSYSKLQKYINILVLGAVGGTAFFLPYIRYFLFDGQLVATGITATQSGLLLTFHTIINVILYIPGGALADRIEPKKAIAISLGGTALLTFIYALTLNYTVSIMIWIALSFTTTFVFWTSLMKTIRIIGTEKEQGLMYGLYYGAQGLFATIVRTSAMAAYNTAYTGHTGTDAEITSGFVRAVITGGVFTVIVAVAIMFLLRVDYSSAKAGDASSFNLRDCGKLLTMPVVWIAALIGFIGYGFFTSVSYFTPYLTAVRGLSAVDTGFFGIVRSYGTLMLAPVGGLLADKVFKSASRWIAVAMLILAALFAGALIMPSGVSQGVVSVYTLIPGIVAMMMYSQVFVTISEAKISRTMTATVIGIMSIIAFLPDSIYHPLFGSWIDNFAGDGYVRIFTFLIISGVVGAVLAFIFLKINKRNLMNRSKSNAE
ncbi:MAG: MFS transporter [Lachnospiraceae bacterium]|nr:MFS transporter [Lachnospiraceae bacterium]